MTHLRFATVVLVAMLAGSSTIARADFPPVRVVIFTHVEDNTPSGTLGSSQSRQNYLVHRANFLTMAAMAESTGVPWTLQPDWKFLEAALLYEDASLMATTNGKNVLRYLKEDRGAFIDPHSHENGGYNYTDVAHLLDSLGVGGSTVIGGHVWDPFSPQFAEWDRFRVPVAGQHYPNAVWRGDVLIGSGTPNHANDPTLSGLWRPRDRDHYFEDDPAGNIVAIGQWKPTVESVQELITLYRSGTVPPSAMLTFNINVNPATLNAAGGFASVRDTVYAPVVAWRDSGLVEPTDFTSLTATWQSEFGGVSYLYAPPTGPTDVAASPRVDDVALASPSPNPVRVAASLRYSLSGTADVELAVFDVSGRKVAVLVNERRTAGNYAARWDAAGAPAGMYVCRLTRRTSDGVAAATRRLIVVR